MDKEPAILPRPVMPGAPPDPMLVRMAEALAHERAKIIAAHTFTAPFISDPSILEERVTRKE